MESDAVTQKIPNTWAFWSDDYHSDRCVVCGREAGGRSSVSVRGQHHDGKRWRAIPAGRKALCPDGSVSVPVKMTNTPAGSIKAWAPSSSPPKAASLFCGAGGACLGLRQAGYDVIAGVDFDSLALATYAAAGGHAVQHLITEEVPVPSEWIGPMTGLDLLWASPPCQPWSRAGKMKGAEDERDAWPATIAAVALLKPRWFVAENVRGVEQHLDGYVMPPLRRLGYVVGWRCLNAADYGVPQTRQRVILVAGPERFRWPMATHWDPERYDCGAAGKMAWRSMGEALGLPFTSDDARRPAPSVCAGHGGKGAGQWSACQETRERIARVTGKPRLTTTESAILQDFPADYPWQGGVTAVYRQIGNAVPPTLSRVVAVAIKNSCGTR